MKKKTDDERRGGVSVDVLVDLDEALNFVRLFPYVVEEIRFIFLLFDNRRRHLHYW